MLNRMKSAFGRKKLAFFLGLAIAIFVSAQYANAIQVIDDTLQVNSLKVGKQGEGGVTYFNGTIINETTGENGENNPVAFGDNVRIDGRVYRGATAGADDDQPFLINDNVEVAGSLTVEGTNVLDAISANDVDVSGYMPYSTYDAAENGKIDASKLDSGIAATLIGTGTISNTEFGYLNGVTSNIQTQLNGKMDTGDTIAATLVGTGTISNTEFGYLNGVSSNIQTQISAKGVGDMLKSTYDVAGNNKIDAGKLDSGIDALLIGGGSVVSTMFDYIVNLNLDNTSGKHLTALGINAGDSVNSTGLNNTFFGYMAGDVTTEGFQNTAVGSGALGANTTGDNNTAIGYNALTLNEPTGQWNTAVGSLALDANTNGVYNTALGMGALGAVIGGDSNIGIGKFAGDNITTGSNNIIIGVDLDAAGGTGAANELNIGDAIIGNLSTGNITHNEVKTVTGDDDGKTLTINESGSVQSNAGASSGGIWNLPEASTAVGMYYTFTELSAETMDINPDDGDEIRGLTNGPGDAVQSTAESTSLTLLAIDNDSWVVVAIYGSWIDVD